MLATLNAAAPALERSSPELATSLLRVVPHKVHSQWDDGAVADELIGCAEEVVDSIAEQLQASLVR